MPEELQSPEPAAPRPVFASPEEALATLGPLRDRIAKATDKTPSTVTRAFVPDRVEVAGIVLPPITMRTWLHLEKVKSPFLAGGKSDISMDELMCSLYVIAMPPAEVAKAIATGPLALNTAVEEFAALVPLKALPTLAQAIAQHLAAEFDPKADMVSQEEGSGSGPKAKASSATGQAPS